MVYFPLHILYGIGENSQEKKCVYNHCNVEIYSQFAILEIFCNLCISEIQ